VASPSIVLRAGELNFSVMAKSGETFREEARLEREQVPQELNLREDCGEGIEVIAG
jgi:hypothetical protein